MRSSGTSSRWRPMMNPPKQFERAAHFAADFRGRHVLHHAGFHRRAELHDFVKLFCFGQRIVNALAAGRKNIFHVNGFRGVRNFVFRPRKCFGSAQSERAERDGRAGNQLAACGWICRCTELFFSSIFVLPNKHLEPESAEQTPKQYLAHLTSGVST